MPGGDASGHLRAPARSRAPRRAGRAARSAESPRATVGRSVASILRTARSCRQSPPITRASYCVGSSVGREDGDLRGALDDVAVRHDDAVGAHDEAGAHALALLGVAELVCWKMSDGDVHDGGQHARARPPRPAPCGAGSGDGDVLRRASGGDLVVLGAEVDRAGASRRPPAGRPTDRQIVAWQQTFRSGSGIGRSFAPGPYRFAPANARDRSSRMCDGRPGGRASRAPEPWTA